MWIGARRRTATLGLGLALALGLAAPRAAESQEGTPTGAPLKYCPSLIFRIPVTVRPEDLPRLRQINLYVSEDLGLTWRYLASTAPDNPIFKYQAPREGEYWFAARTRDDQGRDYPPDERKVEPSLKVIVDTTRPTIDLRDQGRFADTAAVYWEIKDEHLVPKSLVLEYQAAGADADDWRQVPLQPEDYRLIGRKEWRTGTSARVRVRASVRDQAGNVGQQEVLLNDGMAARPSATSGPDLAPYTPQPIASASMPSAAESLDPIPYQEPEPPPAVASAPPSRPDPAPAAAAAPAPAVPPPGPAAEASPDGEPMLIVNAPRFDLDYAVEDATPESLAHVDLWVTRNGGQTWSKQPSDADRASPYPVDLGGEGTFGLWLSVQGVNGFGDPPPHPGARPQQWVDVDQTPPVVQLARPRVIPRPQGQQLVLTWRASDLHLLGRPVILFYRAEAPNAEWKQITGYLENTGQYVWDAPADLPPRFHVRVDVIDRAGNRAWDDTARYGPIVLNRSRPSARIIGIAPSARAVAGARQ